MATIEVQNPDFTFKDPPVQDATGKPPPGGTGGEGPGAPPNPPDERMVEVTDAMRLQLQEAMELLEYAIAFACKQEKEGERPQKLIVSSSITTQIKTFAAAIQIPAGVSTKVARVSLVLWVQFESAYNNLASVVSPVTIQTLRDTNERPFHIAVPGLRWLNRIFSWIQVSRATQFSKLLWMATIYFAGMVVCSEWWFFRYGLPEEGEVDWQNTVGQVLQVVTPMNYGGLGACAFLLRSAHRFIHERSFDIRRRPEYWNRILLGIVSGGAIILLINEEVTTDSGPVRLSTAALGFIAGYSSDFLFNAVERIVTAILPKVSIETMRRATGPSAPAIDVSLKELLDQFKAATDPDNRTLLKSLIKQLYKIDVE